MPYLTRLPSGKWRAVYRGRDGRRHSITRPTKSEARAEALERESEVRRGAWRDPALGQTPFRVWHDRWWASRVVEGNTRRANRSHLDNHVLPRWGSVPLAGIEKLTVQEWVAGMVKAGVGPPTVTSAVSIFSAALNAAVDHGLIPANPAAGVHLPTVAKQPARVLSDEEVTAITGQLSRQDACMVRVDHRLGLRWGEIAGLHVHRVDLRRGELHVVEVLTRHDGVKDYPKSKKSRRTLPLSPTLTELLTEQIGTRTAGLVFTAGAGVPLDYTNWRRRVWVPAVQAAGIEAPLPTFHDLRHTCASNMIADGIDMSSVQSHMGHESLITLGRYVHTTSTGRDRIRASMTARDTRGTHATVD